MIELVPSLHDAGSERAVNRQWITPPLEEEDDHEGLEEEAQDVLIGVGNDIYESIHSCLRASYLFVSIAFRAVKYQQDIEEDWDNEDVHDLDDQQSAHVSFISQRLLCIVLFLNRVEDEIGRGIEAEDDLPGSGQIQDNSAEESCVVEGYGFEKQHGKDRYGGDQERLQEPLDLPGARLLLQAGDVLPDDIFTGDTSVNIPFVEVNLLEMLHLLLLQSLGPQ